MAGESGDEVAENDAAVAGSQQSCRHREILLALGEHFAAYDACQPGPIKETQDHSDAEVALQRCPFRWDGGPQREPQWQVREGEENFDEALDREVDFPTNVST